MGLGVVDERGGGAAVWVARYQADWQREPIHVYTILVPQTAAATWRVLWALVCVLFFLSYFSLGFLSYSVCKQWCFCYVFFMFYKLVVFQVVATSPTGGGTRQFVSCFFPIISLILFFF